MASVSNFLFQNQLHQFLGRRGHIFETLTEGNHGETHALQVLNHLDGTPTVKCNFPDIELLAQAFNKLFDVTIMNDITLSGLKEALALPDVVRHMIPADAKVKVVLRNPEIRQHRIFVILVLRGWRKGLNHRSTPGLSDRPRTPQTHSDPIFPWASIEQPA